MLTHLGDSLSPPMGPRKPSWPPELNSMEFTGLRGPLEQPAKTQPTKGLFIAGLLSLGPSSVSS